MMTAEVFVRLTRPDGKFVDMGFCAQHTYHEIFHLAHSDPTGAYPVLPKNPHVVQVNLWSDAIRLRKAEDELISL